MRTARAAAAALALGLALSACEASAPAPKRVRTALHVRESAGVRTVAVPGNVLSAPGRVVALAVRDDGRLVAAQARVVTVIGGDGRVIELRRGHRVAGLSSDGSTLLTRSAAGARVSLLTKPDYEDVALDVRGDQAATVLSGQARRVVSAGLWELRVPRRVWRPTLFGTVQGVDTRETIVATGGHDGKVSLTDLRTGKTLAELPRIARAAVAPEVTAIDVDARQRTAWLDRAGWLTCYGRARKVMPLAPPGLAAAVRLTRDGAWVVRGGRAVRVVCGDEALEIACTARSDDADLRSAALAAGPGRMYAAGVRIGTIVELPSCG
jgi:hypothetical protein